MAKHKRDMSAFSMRDAPPILRFSPTSLRMRPRSPSKSPSRHSRSPTRSRITDDIFEDLSPARILERFTSASGELAKSIEASTPDQKQFGIRAAVASKKIEEWANEVGGWPWPSVGADGFVMPKSTYGIFGELKEGVVEDQTCTQEYWGSLPAPLVELYSNRVGEIFDDMFDLDIEEIKNKVLDLVATDAQPTPAAGDAPLSTTPAKSKYTRLDTFTDMITHTVLDALPKLHRLRQLLDVWSIRIDILRDIPVTLTSLREADTMLQSALVSLTATNANDEDMILTRADYEIMQAALGDTISEAAKKIDSMLDRLDGRVDTVPGPWLDCMDAIETEYGNWTVSAERKVLEGEWAIKSAKEAELEKSLALHREVGVEHSALSDVGLEEQVPNEGTIISDEKWVEIVPIEHITTANEGPIKTATTEDITASKDLIEDISTRIPVESEYFPEFANSPIMGPIAANDRSQVASEHLPPLLDSSNTSQNPLEIHWPVNDRVFNIPWGLDGQNDGYSPVNPVSDIQGHHDGGSPSPSARRPIASSKTPSNTSLQASERSFHLGSSRSPSVQGRSTPPRLPLPYRIHTEDSQPNSPELFPSRPKTPSPPGSINFRPFMLGSGGAVIGSQPPSPNLPRGRSIRNSVVLENWNGEVGNLGTKNPIRRRDSQTSPTSPIFPSFRGGSPLFPGSRSSSISLRPSTSKKRSETLFGNANELTLLAASRDDTSHKSNTAPLKMDHTERDSQNSQTPQKPQNDDAVTSVSAHDSQQSVSAHAPDPFTDMQQVPTPEKQETEATSPHTPPQMTASSTAHAIMSPSNQPVLTHYDSDDNFPMSPSKRVILDDGGTPRSPKKNKQPAKERRLSLLSMSDDDSGSSWNSGRKTPLQSGRPGLQNPPPKFELKSPWTRGKSSQPSSATNKTSTVGLNDETGYQTMLATPAITSETEALSGSVGSQPTDKVIQVVLHDAVSTQGQDHETLIPPAPHTPTELEDARSDPNQAAHESEALSDYNAILTPVEEVHGNRPQVSNRNSPVTQSLPTEARDSQPTTRNAEETESIPSGDVLSDFQIDGSRSRDLDISRRGSTVSLSSTDTVFKANSSMPSTDKLSAFNNNIALESPRIVEDLASDDGYDLDFSPFTRRSILYNNCDVYQSIEEDYSEPSTPIFSVAPTLYPFTTEDTEEDPSVPDKLESVDELALDAPSFSNVEIDLKVPQSSPAKVSDDQLQHQISEILGSIPAKIELSNAPLPPQKSPMKAKQVVRKRPSRASLSPALRPTYSRAPTPSFTLAPAKSRLSRPRQQNNSDIQLYHLMRSTGEAPIKLFVRLVGESGERVMVRVGGGWADLGEYLKEYSSHHGRRAERGGEIKVELPSDSVRPRMGSIGSLNPAPGMLRTGPNGNVWTSPTSRPSSSLGMRPGSSLQVRKRGTRASDVIDAKENSARSPSMPLSFTSNTLRANMAGGQTPPPPRSVSRQAWSLGPDGEEVHLGPSGPRNKKGELDEGRKRWVDGVVERVRQVSVENSKDVFGALGQVGGTKRVFRKGG